MLMDRDTLIHAAELLEREAYAEPTWSRAEVVILTPRQQDLIATAQRLREMAE
jgi:hypothetical protein